MDVSIVKEARLALSSSGASPSPPPPPPRLLHVLCPPLPDWFHPDHAKMSHDTAAVLVGEAESQSQPQSPSPAKVVASGSSAEVQAQAHDQVHILLHREAAADEAGQWEAMPATTSMTMHLDSDPTQVQPSCPTPSSSSAVPGISSSIQQQQQQQQQHQHPHAGVAGAGSSGNAGQTSVTTSPPDPPSSFFSAVSSLTADAINPNSHSIVTPPTEITPQSPRDVIDSPASPSNTTTANPALVSQTTIENPNSTNPTSVESSQPVHTTTVGAADAEGEPKRNKMIFAHTSSNSIQRRRNYATTNSLTDYEADLTSKDRAKQKEAVKKYLAEKVKDDWKWEWPQSEGLANLEPVKTTEEDPEGLDIEWKERDEWLSNASEDEDDMKVPGLTSSHDTPTPTSRKDSGPLRFDNADGVADAIKKTLLDRKRRRKRRLADEMTWNEGLRCFVARRDAWTCARKTQRPGTAIVKRPTRASISSGDGGSSTAIEQEDEDQWEDDTEIPMAPPILPPENAMRASILPGAYNTIYDKVVVQSLTPSCPMNLKDVTRSCVQGWKRDGEWPPKPSSPETLKKKGRKMSVASLLGFKEQDKDKAGPDENGNGNGNVVSREAAKDEKDKKAGSSIRRSIQKMLKLGHGGD
ncbi:hypothetical protein BKA65DRAFT_534832 [Rhexocercosporidium sp. MPI-PUGE-AT-0058]|nr:hypothetical protein BKA65DRAFT_534832 [Rhexocercosporidium sp. MPI-PUGE-AT-0058]